MMPIPAAIGVGCRVEDGRPQPAQMSQRRTPSAREATLSAGGDEFLADEAFVADVEQGLHERRVVDLLRVVDLVAAGDAGGVDVGDVVRVLLDPA